MQAIVRFVEENARRSVDSLCKVGCIVGKRREREERGRCVCVCVCAFFFFFLGGGGGGGGGSIKK